MAKSYYKAIDGKNYDQNMLAIAQNSIPRKRGKPIIDLDVAKKLFIALKDGNQYTEIEKNTMKYIRDNYTFAKDADAYIRTEIRKFAATNSAKKSKQLKIPESNKDNSRVEVSEDSLANNDTNDYEIFNKNKFSQTDDSSGFRELLAYKNIYKIQSRERRIKIMIRISMLVLFVFMILGITWTVCKPKNDEKRDQESQSIESKESNESSRLEEDSDTQKSSNRDIESQDQSIIKNPNQNNPITSERIKQKFPKFDEFANELSNSDPFKRIPVNKNNLKSSIRYINNLHITYIKNQEQWTSDSQKAIEELSEVLIANPNLFIRIEGHTCWIGTKEVNQALSETRANQVKDFLVRRGVHANQLEARGYGELSSTDSNSTKLGRSRNRRVEFSVLRIQ